MRITPLLLALTLSSALAGCATFSERPALAERPRDLGGLIYMGADKMIDSAHGLSTGKPIIVATTVNVDNLDASSTFGRLASQLVSSRLSQRGFLVKDVTYTGALVVTPQTGEMVLSREASRVAAENDAQAVVAASYAVGGEKIYLNLRLLAAADGRVLSTADLIVPLDVDTHQMVVTGRPAPERRAQVASGLIN